jgi:beta-lactamase class A
MYPNHQVGWPGPSVNYARHTNVLRTPSYRHLVAAVAVFASVLFVSGGAIAKVLASKQVIYQPRAAISSIESPQPSPAPEPAKQQSATAVPQPTAKDASAKVQAVLDAWSASHSSGQWSVEVQGLGDDKTQAAINPNIKYDPASVFKLYFTYTLFQNYSIDSLSKNFVTVQGRGSVSMKDCLDLMIKNSDNPCGEAMGNRLGWGKTTKALQKIGILNTDLNNLSGLTTTATDINLFLQKLNAGQLMSADDQQYLINLMQQQKYRQGIPAGCSGCVVADKTGDLGFVRHDVGIVHYPGGSYTLTIMTNGASYGQIAQLSAQVQDAISS